MTVIASEMYRVGALEKMGHEGLEPPPESTGKPTNSQTSGAEFGALGAQRALDDSDLAALVEAWPTLSRAIKTAMLAIIRAYE